MRQILFKLGVAINKLFKNINGLLNSPIVNKIIIKSINKNKQK
jgi:hypothetical protein